MIQKLDYCSNSAASTVTARGRRVLLECWNVDLNRFWILRHNRDEQVSESMHKKNVFLVRGAGF